MPLVIVLWFTDQGSMLISSRYHIFVIWALQPCILTRIIEQEVTSKLVLVVDPEGHQGGSLANKASKTS